MFREAAKMEGVEVEEGEEPFNRQRIYLLSEKTPVWKGVRGNGSKVCGERCIWFLLKVSEGERRSEWLCGELWNIGRSMATRAKAEDRK